MSQEERFEAVVVGSGFGGTIALLSLAKSFASQADGKEVCLLERGQWWISHEITFTPKEQRGSAGPNMREFLHDGNQPYDFWAYPDNVEGAFQLMSMAKQVSRSGLYDYRILSERIHVLTASGVGGGSLVYSNVTLRPPDSVYRDWPTEREGAGLSSYFAPAEKFIGVNQITTIAGLTGLQLERSKLFQEAAKSASAKGNITNASEGFSLNLSITDVPSGSFNNMLSEIQSASTQIAADPSPSTIKQLVPELDKYTSKSQTNVCERQARCNLGCIPGARHTLNKKIVSAFTTSPPLPIVVKPLCEAYLVEFEEGKEYPYKVHYKEFNKDEQKVERKLVRANRLVIAAGTMGTNELLLKSAAEGLRLSPKLGKGFSPNADLLGYLQFAKREGIDITRGPINTSHAMFKTVGKDFAFSIEDTAISPMAANFFATIFELLPGMRRHLNISRKLSLIGRYPALGLSVLLTGASLPKIQKIATRLWNDQRLRSSLLQMTRLPPQIGKTRKVQDQDIMNFGYQLINSLFTDHERPFASPSERLKGFFVFSCMGMDNADGVISLRDGWEGMEEADDPGEKLKIDWSAEKNKEVFGEIIRGMKQLADEMEPDGGKQVVAPTWDEASPDKSNLVVLHPLGGCSMGDDIENGVVNSYGQVFRPSDAGKKEVYPNLHVIDGSIIPSALGVNSSLTIAAVAFRCVEKMVGNQNWPA